MTSGKSQRRTATGLWFSRGRIGHELSYMMSQLKAVPGLFALHLPAWEGGWGAYSTLRFAAGDRGIAGSLLWRTATAGTADRRAALLVCRSVELTL
ncbi:hypothetical protein SRHO_G00303010 [Serrasalmus rhombeus]